VDGKRQLKLQSEPHRHPQGREGGGIGPAGGDPLHTLIMVVSRCWGPGDWLRLLTWPAGSHLPSSGISEPGTRELRIWLECGSDVLPGRHTWVWVFYFHPHSLAPCSPPLCPSDWLSLTFKLSATSYELPKASATCPLSALPGRPCPLSLNLTPSLRLVAQQVPSHMSLLAPPPLWKD
jgi:hypothetical protein